MRIAHAGLSADLPRGWEGAVTRQLPPAPRGLQAFAAAPDTATSALPSLHLGNFPLPAVRGDFGSRAVDRMTERHAFVALIEYGPECVGTALFEAGPPPSGLRPADFSTRQLQRRLPGQAGFQRFFTWAERAFCTYVVLGSARRASALVPEVNHVLARIAIEGGQR